MSQATDYGEMAIANALAGGPSTTRYVKLHTSSPGEAATSGAAANTTRQGCTFGLAAGPTAANTSIPKWTGVPNAETYSFWSLWNAATGGNALCYGAISPTVTVAVGDNFEFPVGQLTITGA